MNQSVHTTGPHWSTPQFDVSRLRLQFHTSDLPSYFHTFESSSTPLIYPHTFHVQLQELKELFVLYDKNGNGVLEFQVGSMQGWVHHSVVTHTNEM